jgi:hypothetical protein
MGYEHSVVQIVNDAFNQILSEFEVTQMIERIEEFEAFHQSA